MAAHSREEASSRWRFPIKPCNVFETLAASVRPRFDAANRKVQANAVVARKDAQLMQRSPLQS
jgi:hypothetical protein